MIIIVSSVSVAAPIKDGAGWQNGGTGSINIGQHTNITVGQKKSIIHWNSFNTGIGETVTFNHGGFNGASVLNRVTSGNMTFFNGSLNAQGMNIYLINPAGMVFAKTASINATQFIASGLNPVDDQDLLNGRLEFSGGTGTIRNSGMINADTTILIGKSVTNKGIITGDYQVLAAGSEVFLKKQGSKITVKNISASLTNYLFNEGEIKNGHVVLAAGDIYSAAAISGVKSLTAVSTGDLGFQKDVSSDSHIAMTTNYGNTGNGIAYYGGDIHAADDIVIDADVWMVGQDQNFNGIDQKIQSVNAKVTINGTITKVTPGKLQILEWIPPEPTVPNNEPAPIVYPDPLPTADAGMDLIAGTNYQSLRSWFNAETAGFQYSQALQFEADDFIPYRSYRTMYESATILQEPLPQQAFAGIIESLVSQDAPLSPEQTASISQMISMNVDGNGDYANAVEWLNALENYITVLNREMGWPLDDAVTLALERYTEDNPNTRNYLQSYFALSVN